MCLPADKLQSLLINIPIVLDSTAFQIYCAIIHSLVNYGFILCGNSLHSAKIFKIQKNITRIITRCRSGDSCRDLFKDLKILSLQSQFIL